MANKMMLTSGMILNRLYDCLETSAKNQQIVDLRIGLGYVCVKLDSGVAGLAAVIQDTMPGGCTVLKEAGTLAGSCSADLLKYLVDGQNALHRAIGLATANALTVRPEDSAEDREATTYFNLQPGEKVTMVGLFAPLVERIRTTGAFLTVIERNPERCSLISDEEKKESLKNCDVAIITATTLLNNTLEETLLLLGKPRIVALLGPSTPLVPVIFQGTPVTHLGGAVNTNASRILQIISEGGGTPALRPYLRFVNLTLNQG